jgi:hypothetical protein
LFEGSKIKGKNCGRNGNRNGHALIGTIGYENLNNAKKGTVFDLK